jgi:hypothetical protein
MIVNMVALLTNVYNALSHGCRQGRGLGEQIAKPGSERERTKASSDGADVGKVGFFGCSLL